MIGALTVGSTAARLGTTRRHVNRLIRCGRLRVVPDSLGSATRVLVASIEDVEERRRRTPPRPASASHTSGGGLLQFRGRVLLPTYLYAAWTFPNGQWEIVGFTDSGAGGRALVAWLAANADRLPERIALM